MSVKNLPGFGSGQLRFDLAARNIEGYEGHPKTKETYIENSEVEIRINLDSSGKYSRLIFFAKHKR